MDIEAKILKVIRYLKDNNLSKAIDTLNTIYFHKASLIGYEDYETIVNDFQLMKDYTLRGFIDPHRDKLYTSLVEKLYKVSANLLIDWKVKNRDSYTKSLQNTNNLNTSPYLIKNVLENYVSDLAMESLNTNNDTKEDIERIYKNHFDFISRLFHSVIISHQWGKQDSDFYTELLTSPTIDTIDQQLIVSAITIALINVYDHNKFIALYNIYITTDEESVRQRALVGIILSLEQNDIFAKKQQVVLAPLLKNKDFNSELLNFQIQIYYSMIAEEDGDKIQKEIMPTLLKNSNANITKFGIIEQEEENLSNIIDPTMEEQKMEKMDKSIQKMIKMQKAGSDIYFGGFKMMKNFSFFNYLPNWFMPFTPNHPLVKELIKKIDTNKFIDILLNKGTFCNSDKYSLIFAIASIFDKLPSDIKEVIGSGADIGIEIDNILADKSNILRRYYIQDLYRFFKIGISQFNDFVNPFSNEIDNKTLFLTNPIFKQNDFEEIKISFAIFLYKHKEYNKLEKILDSFSSSNVKYYILRGYSKYYKNELDESLKMFEYAEQIISDNEWLLKGKAQLTMKMGKYNEALSTYNSLINLNEQNKLYRINYAICLLQLNRIKEALNNLYELDFKYPDSSNIKRVLAWANLCAGNPNKSKNIYEKLLETNYIEDDILNLGYTNWIIGNITAARDLFIKWQNKEKYRSLEDMFTEDDKMLNKNKINNIDKLIMLSLVNG